MTIILVFSLFLSGCTSIRYAPLDPAGASTSGMTVRITLTNDLQYVLADAIMDEQTVTGTSSEHGLMSVSMAEIKLIEKADGRTLDADVVLRLIGIAFTIAAIIVVSCAIDKDCTSQESAIR